MRRFGARLLVAAAVCAACFPYRFAGGGLPSHIKTVAVLPFDNETPATALQGELHERMRREVQGRLGLREAAEARADAVVRGRIIRYEADVPVSYSADRTQANTAGRRLEIVVDVEIVDQQSGKTLWSRKGLSAEADYRERAEVEGRRQAVEKLVNDVIAGAQSQW